MKLHFSAKQHNNKIGNYNNKLIIDIVYITKVYQAYLSHFLLLYYCTGIWFRTIRNKYSMYSRRQFASCAVDVWALSLIYHHYDPTKGSHVVAYSQQRQQVCS